MADVLPGSYVRCRFIRTTLPPHLPRRRAGVPDLVEGLPLAVGVHGVEEAAMAVGHQLALVGQPLQRLALQDRVVAVQVVEDLAVEDEEAGAGPGLGPRL